MADDRGTLRRISWRDLFPWLIILRTFRIAISPSLLALATLALLVSPIGWRLGSFLFLPREYHESMGQSISNLPPPRVPPLASYLPDAVREYLPQSPTGFFDPYFRLAEPPRRLFDLDLTIGETAYYLFGTLWSLVIWAFVGGAITRRAIVQLATDEPLSIKSAVTYAGRRYLWYFLTPLYPLLGILLIVVPIAILGLPLRFSMGVGSIIAGLAWILVVLASLAAVWLLGGLIFGWPLMWPAISAERDADPFDAFSRSFSYVYGRPLHYLFYVVVAALFGALAYAVVQGAASLVTEFGFWALSWGGGGERVSTLRDMVNLRLSGLPIPESSDGALTAGATLMALVVGLIRLVVTAYTYCFFWCAASAIYLLLRRDLDEKETDEVYLETPATAPIVKEPVAGPSVTGTGEPAVAGPMTSVD